MKKTLIALASAAAASGSFAQVVLSGNLDIACYASSGTAVGQTYSTCSTVTGAATTSTILINATEDLGGGMKALVQYELDPRTLQDGLVVTAKGDGSSAANTIKNTTTGLTRGQTFVGLSGGFGSIKLGAPNDPSLDINSASSPLGTGIGSGYSANGVSNTNWSSYALTRTARSAKYESPAMNGLTFSVMYAPGGDQTYATSNNSTALGAPNARAITSMSLKYSMGNLNLAFANVQQAAATNSAGWYSGGTAGPFGSTTANFVAANYKLGAVTVYGGAFQGNPFAGAATPSTGTGSRVAAKFSQGNIDLMAQFTQVSTTTVADVTTAQKTRGLRADYNLSKTAAVYFGMENYDSGASSANTQDMISVGVRKSF